MTNVKLPRRKFLHLAAGAAALPVASQIARAQTYPTRPVRLIIGIAPGSAPDILGRLVAQSLSERLGQPFTVENRPGGGGNIAIEAVVKAPADGYTLLLITIQGAANATLYEKLNYNFTRDIEPIASISRETLALEVNPSFPAKSVPELIAYARANPGKVNMASAGIGSTPHLAAEQFKIMTRADIAVVQYRGSAPALVDLIGGQVQTTFGPLSSSIEYVRAGKLRALAVSTASRSAALPDIPPLADFLPGFDVSGWFGIGAPKNTPAEIVERLNKEINAVLTDAKVKARIADLGGTVFTGSQADFRKFIADETETWAKVIRAANIKAE